MALPPTAAAAGGGASLTVRDYVSTFQVTKPADATGVMTATFDPVPPGLFWLIERITVSTTSATPTTVMVYAGDPSPYTYVDGSAAGNLDVADESSPILVNSATSLTAVWAGASVGAVGTIRIQYQLVSRG
jgi:hypothetical protein